MDKNCNKCLILWLTIQDWANYILNFVSNCAFNFLKTRKYYTPPVPQSFIIHAFLLPFICRWRRMDWGAQCLLKISALDLTHVELVSEHNLLKWCYPDSTFYYFFLIQADRLFPMHINCQTIVLHWRFLYLFKENFHVNRKKIFFLIF